MFLASRGTPSIFRSLADFDLHGDNQHTRSHNTTETTQLLPCSGRVSEETQLIGSLRAHLIVLCCTWYIVLKEKQHNTLSRAMTAEGMRPLFYPLPEHEPLRWPSGKYVTGLASTDLGKPIAHTWYNIAVHCLHCLCDRLFLQLSSFALSGNNAASLV